jgi:PII-like signaling protein
MTIPKNGRLLRVFVGESDKCDGKPLYEAIVQRARSQGMAGATVLRGFMGFGAHSRIHTAKLLDLSQDLPIVVEIVDAPEKVDAFVQHIEPMIGDGLMMVEAVDVLVYRAKRSSD